MEPSNLLVVSLGMGTVFFGLICLIVICMITSSVCRLFEKREKNFAKEDVPKKQEIVAAVCAVIAEETGADAKNIKVLSFKRI